MCLHLNLKRRDKEREVHLWTNSLPRCLELLYARWKSASPKFNPNVPGLTQTQWNAGVLNGIFLLLPLLSPPYFRFTSLKGTAVNIGEGTHTSTQRETKRERWRSIPNLLINKIKCYNGQVWAGLSSEARSIIPVFSHTGSRVPSTPTL